MLKRLGSSVESEGRDEGGGREGRSDGEAIESIHPLSITTHPAQGAGAFPPTPSMLG